MMKDEVPPKGREPLISKKSTEELDQAIVYSSASQLFKPCPPVPVSTQLDVGLGNTQLLKGQALR